MSNSDSLVVETNPLDWWTLQRGDSPLIATAIYNGHQIRKSWERKMAIGEDDRTREEDPFTEFIIRDIPNRIVFHRSRFAVDLNRSRDEAVYLSPEQSWGLEVWDDDPTPEMIETSLGIYDEYYRMLEATLKSLEERCGTFVVLDVHSYNHRREGADKPPTDPEAAPEINIGTFSMPRRKWAHIVDPFIEALSGFRFHGHMLDVRENVAFEGKGQQTRFIHEKFPASGCAIAIEFKKFFMDEWTGRPSEKDLIAMRELIASTRPILERAIMDAG